jgi:hypothetical protein
MIHFLLPAPTAMAASTRLAACNWNFFGNDSSQVAIKQGDEILVLPRVQTKSIEVTRGISQIIYQIAIAAKVILDL